jgi:hypothetical protein
MLCAASSTNHLQIVRASSLNKAHFIGQDLREPKLIKISNYELEFVQKIIHLGSTISKKLSLETEINSRFGTATITSSRLTML